jgi:hypothetical protein
MLDVELGDAADLRRALDRALVSSGHRRRRRCAGSAGATFVTLMHTASFAGDGTIDATAPAEDVEEHARRGVSRSALRTAFGRRARYDADRDLAASPVPFAVADEHDLRQRLRPGIDGVVIAWRGRRATFLPQVWDHMADPRAFVDALKRKAGLATNFWDDEICVARYSVTKFREPAPRPLEVHS